MRVASAALCPICAAPHVYTRRAVRAITKPNARSPDPRSARGSSSRPSTASTSKMPGDDVELRVLHGVGAYDCLTAWRRPVAEGIKTRRQVPEMETSRAGENLLGLRSHRERRRGEQERRAVDEFDQSLGAFLQARNRRPKLSALMLAELPRRPCGAGAQERAKAWSPTRVRNRRMTANAVCIRLCRERDFARLV